MPAGNTVVNLNKLDHTRKEKDKFANILALNPHILDELVQIARLENQLGQKGKLALEIAAREKIEMLAPYIKDLLKIADKPAQAEENRAMAKIMEEIATAHATKSGKISLTRLELEKITRLCFDWLISSNTTAIKVYSMQALFLIRNEISWIAPELKMLLEQNFHLESAGYKARAQKILNNLE